MPLLLSFAAICLAYLLPGHYVPWVAFEQQVVAALALVFATIGVLASSRTHPRLQVTPLAWIVLAASVVPLIQLAAHQLIFVSNGVLAFLYLAALFTSLVVGNGLAKERRREFLEGLSWAFVVAGALSTCLAAMQWWGWTLGVMLAELGPGSRPFANLAQPNHLATLLGLSMSGVLLLYERRRVPGVGAGALLGLFAVGMLLTQSRTAWVFIALLVVWRVAMARRVELRIGLAPLLTLAAAFACCVASWDAINVFLLLQAPASLAERLQGGTRAMHWQALWDAAVLAPWFGYGWGQVGLAQQAVALDRVASHEWLTSSHNLLLDLVLWNGFPLGLVMFGSLVWWFIRQVRSCRTADQWTLMIGVAAILLHALLEYPLEYTYFLIPLGLMMGALEAPVQQEDRTFTSVSKRMVAVPLGLLLLASAWVVADYQKVQVASRELRFMLQGFNLGVVHSVPPPDVVLLDSLREQHRFWNIPIDSHTSPSDLEMMARVAQQFAAPPALMRHALIAGLNGRREDAVRSLGLICKLHVVSACLKAGAEWRNARAEHPELSAIDPPTP